MSAKISINAMAPGYSGEPARAVGRVVIAMDKFRGSMSAVQVTALLARYMAQSCPDITISAVPVADGGEGTLDAALSAGFSQIDVVVTGPSGRPVDSAIGVRQGVAVVELALASGLNLLPARQLDPLGATSRGTGELIRAALDAGCKKILLGVGGSASTDGGAAMLQALGVRLVDAQGEELAIGGGNLGQIANIDLGSLDPRIAKTEIVLASDVDNPLLGPNGAVAVFAAQKGASSAQREILEASLQHWAAMVDPKAASLEGAGAAGGVGYAAMAVLGATRRAGIEVVLELADFDHHLAGSSLVITGEGSLDNQSLAGKAPIGVARACAKAKVPVIAVCGRNELDEAQWKQAGLSAVYALSEIEPDNARSMANPGPLLCEIACRIVSDWLNS